MAYRPPLYPPQECCGQTEKCLNFVEFIILLRKIYFVYEWNFNYINVLDLNYRIESYKRTKISWSGLCHLNITNNVRIQFILNAKIKNSINFLNSFKYTLHNHFDEVKTQFFHFSTKFQVSSENLIHYY